MRKILILDMSDNVAKNIQDGLDLRGFETRRMCSLIQFGRSIAMTSTSSGMVVFAGGMKPDLIINFHSQNTKSVRRVLGLAELCGIRVMNSTATHELCDNRMRLLYALRGAGMVVPDFFYGHPLLIPDVLGDEVVCKDPAGHLVIRARRDSISGREELVYCEALARNQEGNIRSVYRIGQCIFTMEKADVLGKNRQAEPKQVANDSKETTMVSNLCTLIGLDYCNVDFIDGIIIDVNCFPNIFRYPTAVTAIVEHVGSMLV